MLHEDKRSFFRMMINADLSVTLLDDEAGRVIDGVCRDLSATGMAIELDEPLEIGVHCRIRLDSTNVAIPPLDAIVRVHRCSAESDNAYIIGTEIVEFN